MQNRRREREILERIASQTGLSVSSVYKIRSDSFAFSQETAEQVERLARQYGLGPGVAPGADLRIGVLIPCRPAYFWREAAQGMREGRRRWEKASGRRVQLLFFYYGPSDPGLGPAQPALSQLAQAGCDGYVLFPVGQDCCLDFIRRGRGAKPLVLFNDLPRGWEPGLLQGGPDLCCIGADSREEGEKAAEILGAALPGARHILTALTYDSQNATAALARIGRFRERVLEADPRALLEPLQLKGESKLTPALLAGEIWRIHQHLPVDCIYISSGVTHLVCRAVEKLRRRYGEGRAGMVCIGHELLPSDRKYLLDGIEAGYVKQDVYRQGRAAVEALLSFLWEGVPLENQYFPSSRFIR